jgi:putative heme-binding domain-containing protein
VLILGLSVGLEAQEKKAKQPKQPAKREATPADALAVPAGFKIELLHTADPATEGSWICMCKDNKGRLIISGQQNQPTLRVTIKDGKVAGIEKLALPITGSMGLLYAHDSLYVNGIGPQGFGLYRCKDTKGKDQYDSVELLKRFAGSGEHGPHAVVLGPDDQIYVMNGNHTALPEGLEPTSPHKNFREDQLLPRQWDGNGHATGILAPGGYVLRTDPAGKKWDLMLAGFRNAYDMAFNADGELFTYDSDMEWDWGMPWYRPTRVNHCTSGAEFGWRSGSGKWPAYYADSLPGFDVGVGSPTGVSNGLGAKFPAKYQNAIYVLDWTYGRIIAMHLTPKGSTYTATMENFVAPKGLTGNGPKRPLNVTDMVIGDDGAAYFTIGGRNTQAALYRVSYEGPDSTAPAKLQNEAGSKERAERRALEAFHGKVDPKAVDAAWKYLGSPDRFLRYAARIVLEWQPVGTWKERALTEKDPQAALTALLALARVGDRSTQADLLKALEKFPLTKLSEALQLDKCRVLQVSFIRQGQPIGESVRKLLAELEPAFPGSSDAVNRETALLLINLQSPKVLARALKLMADAKTQEEQFFYLFHLRTLPVGFWTLDQRKEYLTYYTAQRKKLGHAPEVIKWFEEAGRPYADGSSFNNFLKNFLKEFVANLSSAEYTALKPTLESINKEAAAATTYDVKPRPVVKAWKIDEILPMIEKVDRGRSFEKGKEAYAAAQCLKCHRFGESGGGVGPDLTAISSRFGRREILESVMEPSKVISEQYHNEVFNLSSGKVVVGRVVDETADTISVQPNSLDPARVVIKKKEIEERAPSKVSPMPDHLVDVLTADEILDLLAYMESAGRRQYRAFQK